MLKSSKILMLIAIFASVLFTSCQDESLVTPNRSSSLNNEVSKTMVMEEDESTSGGTYSASTIANLMAGQYTNMGTVEVKNDKDNLYVTYTATGKWYFKELHLYVGVLTSMPKNNAGNPTMGNFPYKTSFSAFTQSHTFTIPLNSISVDCFAVAAHASVGLQDDNGATIRTETAWGAGTRINTKGNWATYFEACKQEIIEEEEGEGCSMSQGYWFASPASSWPSTGVTVAGHTYTYDEAKAIWNTSNQGGLKDSKKAFCQVTAILLSQSTINNSATVWSNVSICQNWLATLGKLSPTNLPTGNATVSTAAGEIGDWINANHCP